MDDILILLLIMFFVFALGSRRRKPDEMLGYRRLEGDRLVLDDLARRDTNVRWRALRLEYMPFVRRRRIVLSIELQSAPTPQRLETLLWRLAADLYRRVQAHVVVIEAFKASPTPLNTPPSASQDMLLAGRGCARLIFAPDGRGWSGDEEVVAALERPDSALTYPLRQVHVHLQETLDEEEAAD